MLKYSVFIGAAISLTGAILYIIKILKGKVKPNRVSRLIWSIAPIISSIATMSQGGILSSVPIFMVGLSSLLIFFISLFKKEAYWKITKFDCFCGLLSILGLILWLITEKPILAIIYI